MKKVLILFSILLIFIFTNVHATEVNPTDCLLEYGIYDRNKDSQIVTRGEAVEAILYLAGLNTEMAWQAGNAFYYSEVFKDVVKMNITSGYLYVGADTISNGVGDRLFLPDRPITLSEATALMVRCLYETKNVDLNSAMTIAIQEGLLSTEDTFYSASGEKEINPQEFAVLLDRMLDSEVGYIWGKGEGFRCVGIEGYISIPTIDYSKINIYRDNFEYRNAKKRNEKEYIIKDFSDYKYAIKKIKKHLDDCEHFTLIVGCVGGAYITNGLKCNIDENQVAEIEDSLNIIFYDYMKEPYPGCLINSDKFLLIAENERFSRGIVVADSSSEKQVMEQLKKQTPFVSCLVQLEDDCYYFESYKR